ncbi:MAG: DUF4065 domain-containing protein [Alphaproteobacteria bacterium GM202ARS2]|nr:DUF4065 domain-containing protein [Alphaproteobacteria bacterium GM202ARS2]
MPKQEQEGRRNPLEVANYIIRQGINNKKPYTLLQIIKLVYIAHGWYMALKGSAKSPLISEDVMAWKYGPVVITVYHALKTNGNKPIKETLEDVGEGEGFTEFEKSLLNRVLEKYGHRDGVYLSALTHQEGTPWYKVYDGKRYNEIIDNQLIYQHFKKLKEENIKRQQQEQQHEQR